MPEIMWKNNTSPYSNGEFGYLNDKVKTFYIYWNLDREEPDKPYQMKCYLPGIKQDIPKRFADTEDGKKFAQKVLDHWLKITGLLKGK